MAETQVGCWDGFIKHWATLTEVSFRYNRLPNNGQAFAKYCGFQRAILFSPSKAEKDFSKKSAYGSLARGGSPRNYRKWIGSFKGGGAADTMQMEA